MVDVGDGWLVIVGGFGGVWLVEVAGCRTTFFSSYFLSYAATTFKTFSALFIIFLDENMIIIMTLLGKIFGERK